jgi:hypothetical protein
MRVLSLLLALELCALAAPPTAGTPPSAVAVGHEYRQDDCPSIATAPDGSVWVTWLSFAGDRDDVAIRRLHEGKWSNLQWVPGASGDNWLPQLAADAASRVWVVWSQQIEGNWDLYARRFDPSRQEWGALERLTSHPLPDINPRMWSDGKGRAALVWQAFRGKNSNIFLKTLEGDKWSPEVRVTSGAANDWEPAVALDSSGTAWVAYDSYRNGNYDVFLAPVRGARLGQEITVAATPRLEARATVAVDTGNRVWVAFEEGLPNWGKDQGYIIRDRLVGVFLGGPRQMKVRCYANGQWREPEAPLPAEFRAGYTFHPHLFSDGRGSVWVGAALRRFKDAPPPPPPVPRDGYQPLGQRGYWEYWLTRFDGQRWSDAVALPSSRGRTSTRIHGALNANGELWLAWPTDGRTPENPHRPIRGQVYAAMMPAPPDAQPMTGKPPAPETIQVKLGHADEAGDVRAIREYSTTIGGKKHRLVRGDLHRHTELSWDISGTTDGSLQDFYRYMLDVAAMDFGASTDHQGGAWPYWWWYTQKMTDMHHVPGAYVAIQGYERSAQFPFGHRNIFFQKRSQARVTPFFVRQGAQGFGLPAGPQGDEPPVGSATLVDNDTPLLFEELRRYNGLAIPHTPGNRMGTDWRYYDPQLDPVVEIYQGCRTSFEQLGAPYVAQAPRDTEEMKIDGYQPEGMVSNAWAKGYRLGVIASSDHFSTHLAYAMVYAGDLTREGILDAIRKRHTYGATDNVILEVRMGGHFMGDQFRLAKALPLRVKARGTALLARIDVIKDGRVIYSTAPNKRLVDFSFTDASSVAGRHYYYVRLVQQDGMIAWSSPLFLNWQ